MSTFGGQEKGDLQRKLEWNDQQNSRKIRRQQCNRRQGGDFFSL